jgi:outer membrane protein assembly factor BamB
MVKRPSQGTIPMRKFTLGCIACFLIPLLLGSGVSVGHSEIFACSSQQLSLVDARSVLLTLPLNGTVYGQELLWKANTTGTNYEESAVTYADGMAYVGSCSTHGQGHDMIFAVNITHGDIVWSRFIGPGYVGPVIDGNVVFIGTCTHGQDPSHEHLYAFNRLTGEQLWNMSVYGGIAESIQYDAQKLYFCTGFYAGKIYAVNKNDGSIDWTYSTGYNVCPNKPMLKDNMVYAAFWNDYYDGKLFKINASSGNEIWSRQLSAGPWDNSITADGKGHLFLALYYGSTLNAYYESNGSLYWTYQLHGGPLSFNAYHQGVVFISDTSGYVYALNATRGSLLWETKIGGDCDISSPTLSGGLLFIGTRDGVNGAFFALNETSGAVLWKYPVGVSVTAPPSIANGMMLCGTDGWFIYAFDFGAGSGNWMLHRYDSWNTAYSPTGLTEWQFVRAICSTNAGVTDCVLNNAYDHDVSNVTLKVNFNAYWYDDAGNLLKSGSDNYTIGRLSSGSTMTLTITKTPFPRVQILKPENALYIANRKIMPLRAPVILGRITVEVNASSDNSTISRVEFYIDGELKATVTAQPYSWTWDTRSFSKHTIKIKVYNSFENSVSAERLAWKFF